MRKKILYIITKSEPLGGAQRYVLELASSLSHEDFDVAVGVGGDGSLKKTLDERGVRTVLIPHLQRDISIIGDLLAFVSLYRLIRRERPDVLHLNSSKAGGLGALAARMLGVKRIVFTGHGWGFNESRSTLSKASISLLHWVTILLSHVTIAVSKKTRSDMNHFPFISGKVHTIYNGISDINFLDRESARKQLGEHSPDFSAFNELFPSAFLIGMHSELHPNKGIDVALNALKPIFASRKNIALVIAGGGEEREKLEKMAQNMGISKTSFFLGSVPEVRKYLRAYDLFIMPSRTEALPYALIEAGLASLPAIASNVGGIPEIIEHEKTGVLVPPNDSRALEGALMTCMQNPETCTAYGTQLHTAIQTTFPLQKMVRETIALY